MLGQGLGLEPSITCKGGWMGKMGSNIEIGNIESSIPPTE